ncbi:MAG: transglycosylase SLT domain-containing protein, partial [Gemmatimonadota bacterium]|nr:transglycosylase SLT domain-containing protein [Gemmatimonadota bacterium]
NPPGIRTATHPRWIAALCVAPRANSAAIPPSSRLASPAPRRSRCSGGFIHGLLGGFPASFLVVAGLSAVGAPAAAQPGAASGPRSSIPDSVRRDLADGRFWKAAGALRVHLDPIGSASLEDRMALAEAEAGWRNWEGAAAALSGEGIDTAGAPRRFWYLLGTALEAAEELDGAAAALARCVEAAPGDSGEALAARSRLARVLAVSGDAGRALEAAEALGALSPKLGGWTALGAARTLAGSGEAEAVRRMLSLIEDPGVRERGWRLGADAWAEAGDTARALEALEKPEGLEPEESGSASRTEVLALRWRFRLALGDSAGAVAAMEELLERTTRGRAALEAAMAHWRVASESGPEILRRVASALGNGREYGTAVRAWRLAERRGAVLGDRERSALARAYNGSGDRDGAVRVYRALASSPDPSVAAPALEAWANIRTRQGRHGDARTLLDRLVDRFPARPEALDVIFLRGDDHHDAGRFGRAVDHYGRVVSMSSAANRAGLARMRWAQIHVTRGEWAAAREIFGAYLAEFPYGRRWEEAGYWGARMALEMGDTAEAARLLARIREESPLSYYAFLAAEENGPGFGSGLAQGPPPPDPGWIAGEMEVLALLEEAGLDEGADAHVLSMRAAAAGSADALLSLAVALSGAGRTLDGIRVGLEVRERGRPWDLALARVVYPFPYRRLVESRARELGLDPYLVAGLIRQESAFVPAIASPAGATGLMQVMPATGRQLAAATGLRRFHAETLETPELNVRLGTHFLAELLRRYDGHLPLVLSAYNAGPTRANRWRRFPEAEDPRRFTERIPFAETRGYVKNVTRNRALYRRLYGGDDARPDGRP